jgi:hypothetical protein
MNSPTWNCGSISQFNCQAISRFNCRRSISASATSNFCGISAVFRLAALRKAARLRRHERCTGRGCEAPVFSTMLARVGIVLRCNCFVKMSRVSRHWHLACIRFWRGPLF